VLRAVREGGLLRAAAGRERVRMPIGTRTAPATAPDEQELWRDFQARLGAFVGRRIGDPHAAEDVAQDVLLRLHRHLGELRIQDRLDAFAYRIARNAIIDYYRASAAARETPAARDDLIARIDDEGTAQGDEAAGRRALARCLEPLVRQLPDPYREALELTDLGELSQVQAAQRSGLSVPGMKARVQRGRSQLQALLTRCCDVALDDSQRIADVQRRGECDCGCD
jgi:RNA polymerase sigma-70 factor, ECF subfamily